VPIEIGRIAADRDGDVDIVITTSNGLGWYENNGAEAFTYRSSVGSVLGAAFDIADVDGDGDLDVIASSGSPSTQPIVLLLNDGQQGFATRITLTTSTALFPAAIRAADIDGDGDVDFAATDSGSSSGWFQNNGRKWTYGSLTSSSASDSNRRGRDVVPVDFDKDGDMDLATLAYSQGIIIELFRNDGTETFTRETLAHTPAATDTSTLLGGDRLQIADLDGDGDLDAVAGAYWDTRVYRNDGPGPLTQIVAVNIRTGDHTPVAVADVDADGRLEIVSSSSLASGLFWLDDLPFGDYNRDGTVDQADRELYEATLGQTASPPGAGADGDRSGVVDAADLAIWETNQGRGPAPMYRPADFDQNESINGHDFLRWQQRVGDPAAGPANFFLDADLSGVVDGGDLAVWTRQFGGGVPRAILPAESPPASESFESSSAATAQFTLAANVFLEAPAPIAVEEEAFVDHNILIDATAFDAALTSMNPLPLRPTSRPHRALPAASPSQSAPRLSPAIAYKLLGDLWSD
jgi:hypothetical protein